MKRTLKLTLLVAVFALAVWAGGIEPAEAYYSACWDLRECYPNGSVTYCWNLNAELAWCTCTNGWWYCHTGGPF